jgi:hypothetical protein
MLAGVVLVAIAPLAYAAPTPITIYNNSFEIDQRSSPGTTYNDVPSYTSGGNVPSLVQIIQQFDTPLPAGIDGTQAGGLYIDNGNPAPPVPTTSAYLRTTSDLGAYAANTNYTLTVALYDNSPTDVISFGPAFFNGNSVVTSNLIKDSALPSGFNDYSVTLNTSDFPSLVGQPISVGAAFTTAFQFGRTPFIDNLRLTAESSAIPEPTSLALLTPTLLAATRRRR